MKAELPICPYCGDPIKRIQLELYRESRECDKGPRTVAELEEDFKNARKYSKR